MADYMRRMFYTKPLKHADIVDTCLPDKSWIVSVAVVDRQKLLSIPNQAAVSYKNCSNRGTPRKDKG